MGRSTISITDKFYVHRVEQLEREAAERIDSSIGSAVRDAFQAKTAPGRGSVPQRRNDGRKASSFQE